MKKLETIKVLGRYNEETDCAHLTCDENCTLRLNNVIKSNDSYIYQIVIKSLADSTFSLKTSTETFTLSSTTSWNKLIQKFIISDNSTYIDLLFSPGEYWFYNTKLETGIIPTDWTPALEDLDYKVYTIQSEFKQRTDKIEMSVSSKQDIPITSVRYIRDWLNGNNVDGKNYWLSYKIVTHENVDLIKNTDTVLSGKDENLSSAEIINLDSFINDDIINSTIDENGKEIYHYIASDHAISKNNGLICLEIDLGSVHSDIDYIQVWHRFAEGTYIFNHKLEVSIDGVTWINLYDSKHSGGYVETLDGRTYYLNNSSVISSMNKLSISLSETRSSLFNLDGDFSNLKQTVDGINSQVNQNMEDANSAINTLRTYTQNELDKTNKSINDFKQEANATYATIASLNEKNEMLSSQIKQDASSWEALFAELNMGENKEKYDINKMTNITLNKDGITVKNPVTGQITQMTIEQFCGWYNNEKVFWLDKDTAKTIRLLCKKGWDTDTIKMTTNEYEYKDGTILKGTAYVRSGGAS